MVVGQKMRSILQLLIAWRLALKQYSKMERSLPRCVMEQWFCGLKLPAFFGVGSSDLRSYYMMPKPSHLKKAAAVDCYGSRRRA